MLAESAKTSPEDGFSRTRDDDRALAELARRQHGVVSRAQLAEAGFGDGAISSRLRRGRLHRLRSGVYAVGHQVIGREGRWMSAVLSSGRGAVLSHWSAAALWGIRPNSRATVDVTVPHRSRSSDSIRRHASRLPDDERAVEAGIPVTTVPRTVLDLAAAAPLEVIEA
ncbi:MAG TPA: type IV toxin-antitoxin system AbiEi family antitoxin domain-containing protein, partial [Solirubrobacterales bacterium]|nr:type IV toxin-antitoxin system AbiEi family antitoxin domain-containing protein [Solirubrobacterales bacterium]